MRVVKIMNASEDSLYRLINDMIIQDIHNTYNSQHTIKNLKEGYTYTKEIVNKTGKPGTVQTKIEKLELGEYQVSFTSSQGVNTINYSYKEIGDGLLELVYEENFESASKAKRMNHSLMSYFYKRSNKKRINQTLDQIENILKQPV